MRIYPYAWNGSAVRDLSGPFKSDGKWHTMTLDAGALEGGEKLVLGYWADEDYICAGLGGNRLGASYYLQR